MKDYYKILGIKFGATGDQILKAYFHKKVELEEKAQDGGYVTELQDLEEAYKTLSDPEKRQIYDQQYKQQFNINEELIIQPPKDKPKYRNDLIANIFIAVLGFYLVFTEENSLSLLIVAFLAIIYAFWRDIKENNFNLTALNVVFAILFNPFKPVPLKQPYDKILLFGLIAYLLIRYSKKQIEQANQNSL
jgi:curved DNA-binding protein CbpA